MICVSNTEAERPVHARVFCEGDHDIVRTEPDSNSTFGNVTEQLSLLFIRPSLQERDLCYARIARATYTPEGLIKDHLFRLKARDELKEILGRHVARFDQSVLNRLRECLDPGELKVLWSRYLGKWHEVGPVRLMRLSAVAQCAREA